MKLINSILATAICTSLVACGGSSDGAANSPSDSATETKTLSGKAADGYLAHADVCLDINNNKLCDNGEPNTTTDASGNFEISGVTQAQIDASPLLVKIIKDQTIDLDEPSKELTKAYTLSAPAGYTFVSPLTTMVQNEIDNGSSATEATKVVQNKLGTSLELNRDYVAAKNNETLTPEERAGFQTLHSVAQVTAAVIADNMQAIETASEEANIPLKDLISLIINQVHNALDEITAQVKSVESDSTLEIDTVKIASSINTEHISIDADTIKDQVEQNNAENTATSATLMDLAQGDGINWFWGESEDNKNVFLDYGTLKINSEGTVTDIEYQMNDAKTGFDLWTDNNELETDRVLTPDGWIYAKDDIKNIKANDDGSITLVMETEALNETLTAVQYKLDGLNVSNTLKNTSDDGSWNAAIPATLTFPVGSVGYQTTFTYPMSYQFNEGDWCGSDRKLALNGMCNGVIVRLNAIWLDSYWANDFSDLEVAVESIPPYTTLRSTHLIGLSDNVAIDAEIVSGGLVNFYKITGFDGTKVEKLAPGSWKDVTIHGKTLREISAPLSITSLERQQWTNFSEDGKLYLTSVEERLRVTWTDNNINEEEILFNATAQKFILDNLDLNLLQNQEKKVITTADITIDGLNSDWDELEPVLIDEAGDAGIGGLDITEVYLAQDNVNLYLRLDRASLDLPIHGAYYNYWIYFESETGGPEFAVELFHDGSGAVNPVFWDITGADRDYSQQTQIASLAEVNTSTKYIEVAVPKALIDTSEQYSLDFFTHYSHTAGTWDDKEAEKDYGDSTVSVVFE